MAPMKIELLGLQRTPPVLSTAPEAQTCAIGCRPSAMAAAAAYERAYSSQLDVLRYAMWQEQVAAAAAVYELRVRQQALLQMSLDRALGPAAFAWQTGAGAARAAATGGAQQRLVKSASCQQRARGGETYSCTFIFGGIDAERDSDFDLVPRLIGRQVHHTHHIAAVSGGKVRIRGRGSQHMECSSGTQEADVPLQISLSTKSPEGFELGKKELEALLQDIGSHFTRYCRRKGIHPVPELCSEGK
ncbi:unnamed protein product [Polarella glacialis]|uniref:KHDC4/BBP-like KH-domain type I domain-containing protein n=1 Tax=Polarella glacialis TaxID=89957 RepID=A0A813D9P8_POLGL|nr:unnamed protein product [Polarella glacialis]